LRNAGEIDVEFAPLAVAHPCLPPLVILLGTTAFLYPHAFEPHHLSVLPRAPVFERWGQFELGVGALARSMPTWRPGRAVAANDGAAIEWAWLAIDVGPNIGGPPMYNTVQPRIPSPHSYDSNHHLAFRRQVCKTLGHVCHTCAMSCFYHGLGRNILLRDGIPLEPSLLFLDGPRLPQDARRGFRGDSIQSNSTRQLNGTTVR